MKQTWPGTQVERNDQKDAGDFFDTLFSAGGLVLSQVLEITGLTTHAIQNWVKRGFVPPPEGKKYNRDQLCAIILLNQFGDILHLDEIRSLLDYVLQAGGSAAGVYVSLVDVLDLLPPDAISHATKLDGLIDRVLVPRALDKELGTRMHKVLHILILSFLSARLKRRAHAMLETL